MVKYLTLAVLITIVVYGLRGAWPLIVGPSIDIVSPAPESTFPHGIVRIEGTAIRADQVTLNDAPILRKEDGSFSLTLSFPRGGSILTFAATDRFGRHIIETRSIFVP